MARKIIVIEDFEGETAQLEEALSSLHQRGFKAYFASSIFNTPLQYDLADPPPQLLSNKAAEINALQTLLHQKTLLEDELRKYRTLLENSGDLMYAFDFGGNITFVTSNVKEYLGYVPEEVIGRNFLEFIPPEAQAEALRQFGQLNNNTRYSFAPNLLARDGKRVPMEISSTTLYEEGLPVMYIGLARDMTERRRMENEMRKRNRELAALYSVASVLNQSFELESLLQTCLERMMEALEVDTGGMYLLGPEGEFQQWAGRGLNERFGSLFDPFQNDPVWLERVMGEGEVLVIDDLALIPGIDKALMEELGYHSVAVGPLRAKSRVRGAFILARRVASSFSAADRELILSVGRQVGMALETGQLYTELNNTVNQVRRANARLEEATRHKSEFLANMSHELRTPLNAIIGFSEILQDQAFGPLNQKQNRYVTNILTSGKNLLALVNDVLDLSKVEAGKMELSLENFDAQVAINDVLNIVMVMAEKKQIGLSLRTGDAPQIKADRGKFKQILYNLLSNAIKFTPEGGSVEIQTHEAEDYIEIAVIDNGVGIDPADHERIFEEFRMLDSTLTKKQQGTGLGLALSRRLAQLHGGTVRVQSVLTQGSVFTLVLPAASPPEPLDLPQPEVMPQNGSQFRNFSVRENNNGKLALIVEDDDKAAELLQLYLEQSGYRVSRATNGENALVQAKSLRPALISLDIILPTKNGWEVLRELKNDPATRDIPVLVISMVDSRKISFELGAVACFVKPVRREELAAKLEELRLDDLQQKRRKYRAEHQQHGEALHALVIDDNPDDRELISNTLKLAGLTVTTAPDGETGWQMAQTNPPDLVVLDLMMPQLDGFEVLSRLRQNLSTLDVPVFVYTAKELDLQERRRLGHEAEAVLQKGASSRQTLLEAVSRLTAGIDE